MKRHNANLTSASKWTIAALTLFGMLLTPLAARADDSEADRGEETPAPVQQFDFSAEEEGEGASIVGERDAPQIDWACGIVRAKHASLIEVPIKRFFPELAADATQP